MKIIICAAGLGSRFVNEGVTIPKYEIETKKGSIFKLAIKSLSNFLHHEFIFVFRKENFNEEFVKGELKEIGVKNYSIILVDELTSGQAETVSLTFNYKDENNKPIIDDNDSILIYNIDTMTNQKFIFESDLDDYDGYIYAFESTGNNWSFIKTSGNLVVEVAEKKPISNKASIGLYYFNKAIDFKTILNEKGDEIAREFKEKYIAPMYKYMIEEGKKIGYKILDKKAITPLGTPSEVTAFDPNCLNFVKDLKNGEYVCRHFNSIKISDDSKKITKTSTEKKMIDEINWFYSLPKTAYKFVPRIYDKEIDTKNGKYSMTMEKIPCRSFDEYFLNSLLSPKKCDAFIECLSSLLKTFSKHKYTTDSHKILKEMYYDKTIQRLDELKKDIRFKSLFEKAVTINGKKYHPLNYYVEHLYDCLVATGVLDANSFCIIHGDLCFSNIFFTNNKLLVIDPRGSFGEKGIYGDQLYEYAKIMHSAVGLYDYIIKQKVDVKKMDLENNEINFVFHEILNKVFVKKIVSIFPKEKLKKIELIESLLFLSMVPLHSDDFKRQVLLLSTGITKISKFIK